MSASDAAPLPRLGEVFFDVRGSSRSMRLSWYADTGVAVFSIWQGGMCTGTFRLPIGDLPRMIEILQRGPHGLPRSGHGTEQDWGSEAGYTGQRDFPTGSIVQPGHGGRPGEQPHAGYDRDDFGETAVAGYGRDDLTEGWRAGYGRDDLTEGWRAGYGRDDAADTRQPGYGRDELTDARRAGYGRDDAADARRGGYRPGDSADPAAGSYGRDAFSDGPYPGYPAESRAAGGSAPPGWPDGAEAADGYGQERFVPPYVRGAAGEYGSDIPAHGADMPTSGRRAAYRGELETSRSGAADYPDQQWPPAEYSDDPRYRLADESAGSSAGLTGQHSADRDGDELLPPAPGRYATGSRRAASIRDETRDYQARRAR